MVGWRMATEISVLESSFSMTVAFDFPLRTSVVCCGRLVYISRMPFKQRNDQRRYMTIILVIGILC